MKHLDLLKQWNIWTFRIWSFQSFRINYCTFSNFEWCST